MRGARVFLGVALVVGACNGGGGGRSNDTLPPPPETTVTTAVDYAVPAVIDAAYVEKVIAALDHVYGDAIRTLARERKITQDFLDRLAAIYTPAEFKLAQDIWVRDVASGLQGLVPVPGDPKTVIRSVVRGDRTCLFAAVDRSFAATRTTPDRPTPPWYVALIPRTQASSPHNPTPWVISFDGFKDDGSQPAQPCEL